MNPYQMFKTNKSKETEGIVLDYGSFQIKVARAGGSNKRFNQAVAEKLGPQQKALQNGTLPEERIRKIMIEIHVDHVVLGWDGVTDADGNPLEFTRENAIQLFTDLPELFADVVEQAAKFSNFRQEVIHETAKNSVDS
jgi:hypothetical protein